MNARQRRKMRRANDRSYAAYLDGMSDRQYREMFGLPEDQDARRAVLAQDWAALWQDQEDGEPDHDPDGQECPF